MSGGRKNSVIKSDFTNIIMLLRFMEKLFKNIYTKNLFKQSNDKFLRERSRTKRLEHSNVEVKFTTYYGKRFKVDIPEGYNVKENNEEESIIITKDFYNYDFSYDGLFFKSYIHILISKLSFNQSIHSKNMEYKDMKEFILKSPAFKDFESEDIYIGNKKALHIRGNDKISSGGSSWFMIPYDKQYFNIRLTLGGTSEIDNEIIDEIIKSFNISSEYGENSSFYNSVNEMYNYKDIEKGYFSKTDAI